MTQQTLPFAYALAASQAAEDVLTFRAMQRPWVPTDIKAPPRVCPKCKSPYWDRPRKQSPKKS